MYVATQADKDWLLNEQRKLYARSFGNPELRANTHGKPGAYRKAHAGFGRGEPEDRRLNLYGVGFPILTCAMRRWKIPRVRRARRAWVGPGDEGDHERRRDWNDGLQKPSGLKYSWQFVVDELPKVSW